MRLSIVILATAFLCLSFMSPARADDTLPDTVTSQVHARLVEVGKSTFRKFGFRVYNISLWAPEGAWNPAKPFALVLHYTRSVSKDTMVDIVTDDIRDQQVADDVTLAGWQKILNDTLPSVEDGDVLIGLSIPGKKGLLYFNGKQIRSIDDLEFSRAFFNVWLGDKADEDLREDLLGHTH